MNRRTIIGAAVFMALTAQVASATTVKGKVTNEAGEAVAGAEVRIEGSKQVTFTDAKGNYEFNGVQVPHVHLHVYSPDYVHGDNDLGDVDSDQVADFVLTPVSVENIVVTASVLGSSVLESVTPVSVIDQYKLRKIQAETLGETLKNTPGVHSTYFGPVASSPVIRGNDGPRVKIVQNGLDVSDVSRIGPDHNVAANSTSATQVEVLRGPATLQYGSGAIGGVVNVVDKRIPREVPASIEGDVEANYATVNDGKFGRFNLTGGQNNIAFHVDGFKRKTDNADIPGYASVTPDEDEQPGTLESSAMDTTNITAGLSLVDEEGYFGFSVEKLDNFYGVPGHSHHHEEEHEGETEEEHAEHAGEEGTNLDVDMTRYQAAGEWYSPFKGISSLKFGAAYTDYEHVEIEDGEVGTRFTNQGSDIRLSATHADIDAWHGVFGLQYHNSDYAADGEEAYTPPTETESMALFLVEQKKFGSLILELGGRLERTTYNADTVDFELEVAEHHDEEGHEEEHHEDEHEEHELVFDFDEYAFTSSSLSAGLNWEYTPGYSVALTLSRNERAPSQQELFSAGQHLATQTFEVGLVYDMDEEGEVSETLRSVKEEVSNNIDLTFRKFSGDSGYTLSFFYNQADDYIYQSATDLTALAHGHEEEEEEGHEEHAEEGTPVYYFNQDDATIYGVEAEGFVDLNVNWRVSVFGDYIRAKIDSDNLPRIPPLRLGSTLSYEGEALSSELSVVWYDDQTNTTAYETSTDGYTLVNASVDYRLSDQQDWTVYVRANNLFDEEARVHTSFLKDQAPLPGRNLTLGTRFSF
ncbi:TonB-dependent receptor [uncultured Alteromonas sp.]|jgi:iron complex outermembrane receptor protein|uniref:TonB-dependent receptor n=1 Tax=uncultured Alteromonas sp. TaxID=179113 RepID=UPI0025F48185|nr:TonB-dependent receptor [uncultured Alteromonas sp.]